MSNFSTEIKHTTVPSPTNEQEICLITSLPSIADTFDRRPFWGERLAWPRKRMQHKGKITLHRKSRVPGKHFCHQKCYWYSTQATWHLRTTWPPNYSGFEIQELDQLQSVDWSTRTVFWILDRQRYASRQQSARSWHLREGWSPWGMSARSARRALVL